MYKAMASFLSTSRQVVLIIAFLAFGVTGLLILGSNNRDVLQTARKPQPKLQNVAAADSKVNDASQVTWNDMFAIGKDLPLERRFSAGEKVLVAIDDNPDKQAAVNLFKAGDYENAIARFNSSLALNRNDPETWIYLNNAKANLGKETVKIAVVVPIGGNVNVAKEILRGVAQFQNEINQGKGVQGRPIKIEIVNDDNDPFVGRKIAEALVKDTEVMAVVGHQSSDVSIAAGPIYVKGGVVMVSPTSYAQNLNSIGKSIFRTTPNSREIATSLAKQTVNSLHFRKVATCTDSKSQDSQSFQNDFISSLYEYGGKVTATACDFSAPDFNADDIAPKAIQDGADGLLLSPGVEKLGRAVEVIQASKGKIPLLASPSMYTYEILQKGQADANGMLISVAWDPQDSRGSAYERNANALWGGSGSWRTVMAYDAIKVITTGLQLTRDRSQLQYVLRGPTFSVEGVTGPIEFLPTGDRNKTATIMKVIPGSLSGTGYDFASIKTNPVAVGGAALPTPAKADKKSR